MMVVLELVSLVGKGEEDITVVGIWLIMATEGQRDWGCGVAQRLRVLTWKAIDLG